MTLDAQGNGPQLGALPILGAATRDASHEFGVNRNTPPVRVVWTRDEINAREAELLRACDPEQSVDDMAEHLAQLGLFVGQWLHDSPAKTLCVEYIETIWGDVDALNDMSPLSVVLRDAITTGQHTPILVKTDTGDGVLPASTEYQRHHEDLRLRREKQFHLTRLLAQTEARQEFERVQAGEEEPDDPEESLRPLDLGPYIRGEVERAEPTVGMAGSSGLRLLYPGREHAIIGEMESGKTWFALACAKAELDKGEHVVYYHFEEADPQSTVERLLLIGTTSDALMARFHFLSPSVPVTPGSLRRVIALRPSLTILDGKNEAMALHSLGIRDEDGAAGYRRRLVKPFTRAGTAVLSCDHVVKDRESRGRNSIGSVHKDNGIDGSLIMLEAVDPFGRTRRGMSKVFVTKDRGGYLRQHGDTSSVPGKTYMGSFIVDDTPDRLGTFLPDAGPSVVFQQVRPDSERVSDESARLSVPLPSGMPRIAGMDAVWAAFTELFEDDPTNGLTRAELARRVYLPGSSRAEKEKLRKQVDRCWDKLRGARLQGGKGWIVPCEEANYTGKPDGKHRRIGPGEMNLDSQDAGTNET